MYYDEFTSSPFKMQEVIPELILSFEVEGESVQFHHFKTKVKI